MIRPALLFDDVGREWIDCPACAGEPSCLVCSGAGGFASADLPDLDYPCNLPLREGEFA